MSASQSGDAKQSQPQPSQPPGPSQSQFQVTEPAQPAQPRYEYPDHWPDKPPLDILPLEFGTPPQWQLGGPEVVFKRRRGGKAQLLWCIYIPDDIRNDTQYLERLPAEERWLANCEFGLTTNVLFAELCYKNSWKLWGLELEWVWPEDLGPMSPQVVGHYQLRRWFCNEKYLQLGGFWDHPERPERDLGVSHNLLRAVIGFRVKSGPVDLKMYREWDDICTKSGIVATADGDNGLSKMRLSYRRWVAAENLGAFGTDELLHARRS